MSNKALPGRPVCVHCKKRYGTRATTALYVYWKPGDDVPAHNGPGGVISERVQPTMTKDGRQWAIRTVWDGETWRKPYHPFCTIRCAVEYARKAYSEHLAQSLANKRSDIGERIRHAAKQSVKA